MPKAIMKASVSSKTGVTLECVSRNYRIVLDEPVSAGGQGLGMNPVECMLNALGACKAIIARSFAAKMGVSFTELRFDLEGTIDPSGLAGNPEAKIGLSEIHTKYYFKSDEPDEKLQKFIEFVEHTCPVLDTIVNAPRMTGEICRL